MQYFDDNPFRNGVGLNASDRLVNSRIECLAGRPDRFNTDIRESARQMSKRQPDPFRVGCIGGFCLERAFEIVNDGSSDVTI